MLTLRRAVLGGSCALALVVACSPQVAPVAVRADPPPPASLTIVAAGDELVHESVAAQAVADGGGGGGGGGGVPDFVPQLAGLRPVIEAADLALCHLETPLAPAGGPYSGYPAFSAPPELARGLRAVGYDGCSTASNHSLDQGRAGVVRTLDTLDAAGLAHVGTARSPAEAATPRIYDVRGVRVAQLSATYGFNGDGPDTGWEADLLDPPSVLAAAARARAAGADLVVLSAHWGAEYRPTPTDQQRALARRLLTSPDIDLIIGHHAHVVQPLERIGDEWVAYGLGNQLADQETGGRATHEGAMARFTATRDPDGRWRVTGAETLRTVVDTVPAIRVRLG